MWYQYVLGLKGAKADGQVDGKMRGLKPRPPLIRTVLSGREVCGMRGVAVKCIDITQNSDCEGSIPAPN